MVIFFKGCSKCRGDMHLNCDIYGAYMQCIQCGRIKELVEESTRELVPKR